MALYFLWECRDRQTKARRPKFRSTGAIGVQFGTGALAYDHAVPFRYLQAELLGLSDVTPDNVRDVLDRHGIVDLITPDDDRRLNQAGYRSAMPADWDGRDPFARYTAVGIALVPNGGAVGSDSSA